MAGAAAGTPDQIQAQWAEYYRQIGYAYYGQQPGQQQVQPGQQPQAAAAVPGQEPKVCNTHALREPCSSYVTVECS